MAPSELDLPLDEHITNVIGFLRERADVLGLRGQPATCELSRSRTGIGGFPYIVGSR